MASIPLTRRVLCGWRRSGLATLVIVNGGVAGREDERLSWRQHGERVLYGNRWVRLTKVDVTAPDGNRFEHHVVRLQRVAMCVVVDDAYRVLLLWRHRFVTNSWGWEVPGGIVEDGEDAAVTAAREAEEETGWRPRGVRLLAEFQPMPGMVDTPHVVFVADGADRIGDPTDAEEASVVEWVALADIRGLIERGEVAGAGSLVGLLLLLVAGGHG